METLCVYMKCFPICLVIYVYIADYVMFQSILYIYCHIMYLVIHCALCIHYYILQQYYGSEGSMPQDSTEVSEYKASSSNWSFQQ